ncbi:putative glycoside hydrolase [Pontiella sulfatireligans]|uniref:Glycoside-hydrolase family GH114 TIM-barrel domain-containing protein n=1 Tax=Pontiella sulfatireligans TaxID=2750658 RepID=A0A6C2UP83_9BACT|nr:putative glycoside hydrolase [Pontiella sulfatireligans]VGO20826.1 hypothetical protein SCARR_02893 [Pontiella sulfatireligans]
MRKLFEVAIVLTITGFSMNAMATQILRNGGTDLAANGAGDVVPEAPHVAERHAKPWMHTETRLRLFAPAWRDIGEQSPTEAAGRFEVLYGHLDPKPFHEANPDVKMIKYLLGPYVNKREVARLPSDAMGHNADGNIIKARNFENWVVVPDNPHWIDYVVQFAKNQFDLGYDGIFTDSMGTGPVGGNYLHSKPINPNTGQEYTKTEWMMAESKMAQAIRQVIPEDMMLTMNGLARGTRYWAEPVESSPRVLLAHYDGAMSEQIWREPKSELTSWPSLELWMSEIEMIKDVEKRGLMGFWWTKCWSNGNTSNDEPNADVLVPQWRRFALGSYLLAAGPNSYFNFDTKKKDQPKSNAAEYYVEYDAPLGVAIGSMDQFGGTKVYYRRFENGFVVVNPDGNAVNGVEIPGTDGKTFKSWGEDNSVIFPLDVKAHTGLILTRD